MNGASGPIRLNWESLALWFGRLLYLVALWFGQQLLGEIRSLKATQAQQLESLQQTQISMASIARDLQLKTSSRWTQVDQRLWATLLAQKNPRVIVPLPEHQELPGETH